LTGDARYAALNPPLVNSLSALPVLLLDLEPAPAPPPPSDDVFSFWSNGYRFQETHRADYVRIFAAARWAPMLIVAGLGALLFVWAGRLAPNAPGVAGVLAAGFLCLSPNVIAHARIVGTDTGTACFVALAVWSLRNLLRRPGVASALLCGAALGLAQLSKFYALLLYPVFVITMLAWHALSARPRPKLARLATALAGAVIVSLLVLCSGYLWHEVGASLANIELQSVQMQRWQGSVLGRLPLPLPAAYVRAFDGQLVEVGSTIPSFLFGETFQGGRWYFFLGVLALKTPLGLFVALGVAVVVSIRRPRLPARESVLLLLYPVALFALLSLSPNRQLGGRALLSTVPLVWLWAAASIARTRPTRWPTSLAGVGLAATLLASLATYPNYLSYFNPLFGGSEGGYRYASDGNVDIGQDLVLLARYLEDEGVDEVQLLYFGSVDPAIYGIDFEIPEAGLKPGLFAVSVSLYRIGCATYDRGQLRIVGPVEPVGLGEPIAKIGGSIHVYRAGP
jgi:4-amino-4-deoxy-L-arabinose transferase-like glycosyltransferase